MQSQMFVMCQLLLVGQLLWAEEDLTTFAVTPKDCSLECVRQGGAGCEYCRISRADVENTLGFRTSNTFGSCVPWPCLELLGEENCRHYVHGPSDVTVELVPDRSHESDTIIVSWKPSHYGIAFLRGFQVYLKALGLGGSSVSCQLFLFRNNLSLSASHAQQVYTSDPFPGLALGAQYVVTVMVLPVPEEWDNFYRSKIFSTRTCAEKNGLEHCRKDWFPEQIAIRQSGAAITVTFNLAPPNLGIRSYFSLCYGKGRKTYMGITPDFSKNKTHCSYSLEGLQEGTNYTCEIAADEVDAVRASFVVHLERMNRGGTTLSNVLSEAALPLTSKAPLALTLSLGLTLVVLVGIVLATISRRKPRFWKKVLDLKPDVVEPHQNKNSQEDVTLLPRGRLTPPRLLICYSNKDGPAHIRAVIKLGAFLQQHMATQVCLDLWDSLRLSEEGAVGWICRQLQENDFVLVICSDGLHHHRPGPSRPDPTCNDGNGHEEEEEAGEELGFAAAAVALVGEEVGRTKARGEDLSKYMAAVFEYSEETAIPTELGLVSRYTLTRDLPLLFSHLHGVALHTPGVYLKIEHLSGEGLAELPAGAALQRAIAEAGKTLKEREQRL